MSRLFRIYACALAVAGLIGACGVDLEDELAGEPCTVEKDCWKTQECSRTIEEAQLGVPGTCQPEGTGCVFGQQLGCDCNPMDPSGNCSFPAVPLEIQAVYPKMQCDPATLHCGLAPANGGM